MTIAIDFDGTCVMHKYPLVGEDVPGAVRVIKRLLGRGYDIVLYTMRGPLTKELNDAVNWFKQKGIYLSGINHNPTQVLWSGSPKVYANVYIDDAALGCPLIFPHESVGDKPYVDWVKVEEILKEMGLL